MAECVPPNYKKVPSSEKKMKRDLSLSRLRRLCSNFMMLIIEKSHANASQLLVQRECLVFRRLIELQPLA